MDMWDNSNGTGVEAIYVTMSAQRFKFLMRCLRFDDIRTRDQRKALDKLAPIREIFEDFVSNSKNSFNPSDYLSIDEQLVEFRGNCPFRQYIPSKAAKYGIKIYALASASNLLANLEVYVYSQPDGPYRVSNSANDLVLRLVEPVVGSNRNISLGNWFVSLQLAVTLLKEKSLTLVGTIRGNRREVPQNFLADKDREVHTSLFGYHEKATLVSYVPRKNKAVIALSTMHKVGEIDPSTGDKQKPVIITTYIETKFGVDILDKMCKQYDTARNSRRWPLTIFFHLLNVGGVNALNIYRANHNNENVIRYKYLSTRALDLMKPAIHRRISITTLPKEIQERGKLLLGIKDRVEEQPERINASKGRCSQCGRAKDKKVKTTCEKCNNFTCPDHMKKICVRCYE
ncbi:piggyBac transposable element-derived protein 4-like [Homalodisca vitripennis]|uniref:piggyBac transposable element-derived protein 4-like n=1 Tax=Homalodisca vitripennis TaxID=197043 RepID=UPI001EE9C7C8|nr:piggyBac transposable element-derived protein 4-like [Homalodisca vitripennis]